MEEKVVKGYKVFEPDWTCRPKRKIFQYEVGKTYEENVKPKVCEHGFHFCEKASDCFNFHRFDSKNKVAEVLALGEIDSNGTKSCTNKIQILREIPWAELLEIVNTGHGCTGFGNSGDYNSGNSNDGDYNSGDSNNGDCNSGDCNIGNYNSGNYNSGDCNSGDYNKCDFSSGCFNTVTKENIYMFNKLSEWTLSDWLKSEAHRLLDNVKSNPTFVQFSDMTDEEKALHPKAETTGGYLKIQNDNQNYIDWWHKLNDEQKAVITALPNFDKAIFKEITGIDVDEN